MTEFEKAKYYFSLHYRAKEAMKIVNKYISGFTEKDRDKLKSLFSTLDK